MAPPTINGRAAVSGQATFPWNGVWSLEATLTAADDPPPSRGTRVRVELGDLVLSGTVWTSGVTADGRPRVQIFGGANRWRRKLSRRPSFAIGTGVPLRLVVEAFAADVGETVEIAPALRGFILGASWSYVAERAESALRRIRVGSPPKPVEWHVRPDGITWIGDRPTFFPEGVEIIARKVDPAWQWAQVVSPTDAVSALLPGSLVHIDGLSPVLPIHETNVTWNDRELVIEVNQQDSLADSLLHIQDFAAQLAALYGAHLYQLVNDTGGPRVSLRALQAADGYPDELSVEKAFGLPGVHATLTRGALVLVTWRNRDPAQPQVIGYIPGVLPQKVSQDAAALVEIGKSVPDLAEGAGVHVGGGRRPVAMGDAAETHLAGWRPLLLELAATFVRPLLAPPQQAALDALLVTEQAAFTEATDLTFSSTKLGTA